MTFWNGMYLSFNWSEILTCLFLPVVQHILVKPKVKGVEGDEDLPDEVL